VSSEERKNVKLIANTLRAMADERSNRGNWSDGEEEDPTQSLLFKRIEALYTLFQPFIHDPSNFNTLAYPLDDFMRDLNEILVDLQSDGFDPNPYTFVKAKTQFVDCASFSVLFFSDLLTFYKTRKTPSTFPIKNITIMLNEAIDFIQGSVHQDQDGASWASSTVTSLGAVYFNSVYFTSWAMLALNKALEHKDPYDESKLTKSQYLLRQAAVWLMNRKKGKTYFGDKAHTKSGLNYQTYALISLLQSFENQDTVVQKFTSDLLKDYLTKLATLEGLPSVGYLDAFIPEGEVPTYYDDRWTEGTILYALCLARMILPEPDIFDSTYFKLMKTLQIRLLGNRGSNNLWESSVYLMTSNYWAIKSLLLFNKYGQTLTFNISESDLIAALKRTMAHPQVLNLFLKELQSRSILTAVERESED